MNNKITAADSGALFSVFAWIWTHAEGISMVLQWGLAITGIIAGGCAAYYHIKAARRMK